MKLHEHTKAHRLRSPGRGRCGRACHETRRPVSDDGFRGCERPSDGQRDVLANQTVVVRTEGSCRLPRRRKRRCRPARRVDGRGKFLMPGPAEMHAHIPSGRRRMRRSNASCCCTSPTASTTIRGMLGDPRHLRAARARRARRDRRPDDVPVGAVASAATRRRRRRCGDRRVHRRRRRPATTC